MIRSRGFVLVTSADFIVRSAYQMGKTPLLPIYAAALGAGDVFLGFIVAVSTLTGMVLKPFVGFLSDRWGRRAWLLVGTAFFTGMPFAYGFVGTPEQLFAVRIVHGVATAIYGPVTLAYVAELAQTQRAERLGWFSMARNAGYVVGPVAAGWMLLSMGPVAVFTVIGLLSSAAFLPILRLPETATRARTTHLPVLRQAVAALWSGGRTPAVWLAGALDANILIALYAARAFLPLHALSVGVSLFMVGVFFALQHAVHIVLAPIGGRVSDRLGYLNTVGLGIAVLGVALTLLTLAETAAALAPPAVLMGVAQALVFPSTVALLSVSVDEKNLGLGMGLMGTLKNAGKVAGPSLGGVLVYWLDFTSAFRLMTGVMLATALAVWFSAHYRTKSATEQRAMPHRRRGAGPVPAKTPTAPG